MKASGNGTPQQCVANLLNLFQFEVPYARLKGMDPEIIDAAHDEAIYKAKNHAAWLISNYEPRVTIDDIKAGFDENGKLIIKPEITVNEY